VAESNDNTGVPAPVFLFEGDLVALGPFDRSHIDLWFRWINNVDATRTLGRIGVFSREEEERFYETATSGAASAVSFTIFERSSSLPIGTTQLREINHQFGTATFGILIGDPAFWNRGFGTEATRLVLDFAFNALGLHNVLLQVYGNNPRGQRAYEKAGFHVIGRRRQSFRLGQVRYDAIMMDAVADEFESPVLASRLHEPQQPQGQ